MAMMKAYIQNKKENKKMTEQAFRNRYVNKAVHCDTEEKAKELLKLADGFGWTWLSGDSLIARTNWKRENTCYRLSHDKTTGFADLDFYKSQCYEIVKFESEEKKMKKTNTKKIFDLGLFVNDSKERNFTDERIMNVIKLWALGCHGLTEEELDEKNYFISPSWMREVEVEVEDELTPHEIEVLKALKVLGFNWIARDEDNSLYAYDSKPGRGSLGFNALGEWNQLDEDLFAFITWDDEEASSIDELLEC